MMHGSKSTFSCNVGQNIPHCPSDPHNLEINNKYVWSHCGYFEPFSHSLLADNTFLPESTGSAISQGPEAGARGEEGWLVSAEGTAKARGREAALQCQGTATYLV